MASQFTTRIDGERVTITLHSLSEYEQYGIYSDAGNGGEDMRDECDQFLAALSIDFGESSLNYGDEERVLAAAGLDRGDYWYDSAADYYLIRDWPADAPLAARVGVGA